MSGEARERERVPLLKLLAEVLEVPLIRLDESTDSDSVASWDSMRRLFLASRLEYEYRVVLTTADLERLGSVCEIRSVLAGHGVTAG